MKYKVLISFHDAADFSVVYQKDAVVAFPAERAEGLLRLKLIAPIEEVAEVVAAASNEPKKRGRKAKQ